VIRLGSASTGRPDAPPLPGSITCNYIPLHVYYMHDHYKRLHGHYTPITCM
jgi:hypothetical protein